MRVASAVFLLAVGGVWLLFMLWMLLSIAGVADSPQNRGYALAYWSGYLAGPVLLVLGAALLLRRPVSMAGTLLTCLGCLALTGFAIYNSIGGMQRNPLQAPPTYWFYGVMLVVMLLADLAGYKLVGPVLASLSKRH
jgi:hypothetical protein